MENSDGTAGWWLALFIGLGLLVLSHWCAPQAHASNEERLLLARVFVSEAGFIESNDGAGIHTVLINRAGRGSLSRMMRRYSPRATGTVPPLNARQAWVSGLNLNLTRPHAWPESYPAWFTIRPKWQARLDEAAALLAEPHNPCDGEPHHWGGPMDDHRALAAGWVQLECGFTLNHFWQVPGR